MDKLVIQGGRPLKGEVGISGAKNATLPLMAAALLTDEPLVLSNVPALADIRSMAGLVGHHGARVDTTGHGLALHARNITDTTAPYDIVRKMRASILVLGPLLARAGHARVSLPGGCAIGNRPIDLHLKGLKALGAEIELAEGYVEARANGGLEGAVVPLPFASVGATENLMMAASLTRGTTVIENAAREPEISDLAACLAAMGAGISGAGTERIEIEGRDTLSGARHRVIADRIEAGSYAVAAAITGGDLILAGAEPETMRATIAALEEAGAETSELPAGLHVRGDSATRGVDITTQPYPGFPTDMQAQLMALMALSDSASVITETIFENRFMHVSELARMGADITVTGASATIRGVRALTGAAVMATDLRASMSLVLAGLAAEGETVIHRVYHLDRGYERLEEKLRGVGADIARAKE